MTFKKRFGAMQRGSRGSRGSRGVTGCTECASFAAPPRCSRCSCPRWPLRAQDPHPTFTVGTATASRGARAAGVIHVPAGVDAGYDIPVAVIHGAKPGPVLAVVSGAHGTEYASIVAVEMLMAGPPTPAVDPATLSGTLILVPLVNVNSFEKITPHVNPVDNKSMNRFYPGSPSGSQTERASYAITKEVVEKCDHLIDLHGGDLDENLRPYSYWTVTGNQKQDDFSKGMVLAFGLDHIIISADRPKDPERVAVSREHRLHTRQAVVHGGSRPVGARRSGRRRRPGQRRARCHGLPEDDARGAGAESKPGVDRQDRVRRVRTRRHVLPAVARNARVVKGARIGVVRDYWYKTIAEVTAPEGGIVMFVRALPSLKKGDTIVNIGTIKPSGK